MKVYILRADGPLAELSGIRTHIWREAFRSKADAGLKKPEFRKACVTRKTERDLFSLADCEQLRIQVLELQLEDGGAAC